MISNPDIYHPFLDGFASRRAVTIDGLPTTYEYPERLDHHSLDLTQPSSSSHSPSSLPSMSPAAAFLSAFSLPQSSVSSPDAEGTVVDGYTLGPVLAHGGFSTIRRACSTSGGTVAVKIVLKSDLVKQNNPSLARKRLDHEAAIWATLSHEHILPLFSATHTPNADYFFMLLCPTGSLYDIIKRNGQPALPLDDLGVVFKQVVRGLRYLHEVAGIVHRDIKLENVLIDEMGVCRITDFGMARKIGELDDEEPLNAQELSSERYNGRGVQHSALSARHTVARYRNSAPLSSSTAPPPQQPKHVFQPGSLPYASPELLLPPSSSPLAPHPAQDIWALGVLLYAMLTGRLPFSDAFEPRLQMKILHGAYEMPSDIGRGAERVLQGCLERSVHSRWSIDMVDENAWDIVSGAEDVEDDEGDDDFAPVHTKSKPCTRSPSQPRREQQQPAPVPTDTTSKSPSFEAARRRSSSRAKRSLSRAPVVITRSTSRSNSRPSTRRPSPPLSALDTTFLNTTPVFADSPTHSSRFESPVALLPQAFLDRGRRSEKSQIDPPSRSPSPSVLPATPLDTPAHSPSLERGRKRRGRLEMASSPPPLTHTYGVDMDNKDAELDVLSETTRWSAEGGGLRAPLSAGCWPYRSQTVDSHAPGKTQRAGSTPPLPSHVPWMEENNGRPPLSRNSNRSFCATSNTRPIPIPIKSGSRSKSAGYRRSGDYHITQTLLNR